MIQELSGIAIFIRTRGREVSFAMFAATTARRNSILSNHRDRILVEVPHESCYNLKDMPDQWWTDLCDLGDHDGVHVKRRQHVEDRGSLARNDRPLRICSSLFSLILLLLL